MDEFETIEKAFEMIQESLEKVGKKKLPTFARAELNTFTLDISTMRGRAMNLRFETGG